MSLNGPPHAELPHHAVIYALRRPTIESEYRTAISFDDLQTYAAPTIFGNRFPKKRNAYPQAYQLGRDAKEIPP